MPITEKETHRGTTSCGLPYGVSSMQGWRMHMEDAHILETDLLSPINDELHHGDDPPRDHPDTNESQTVGRLPDVSLFAVLDGHRGKFAAEYTGRVFPNEFRRQPQFRRYATTLLVNDTDDETTTTTREEQSLDLLMGALHDAFVSHDETLHTLAREQTPKRRQTPESIFPTTPQDATTTTSTSWDGSGTTAVAIVLTPTHIVCANAGDSRAVLCTRNDDVVVPLSCDHKPTRESEQRRIQMAGGYVKWGRVDGDLAVSRGFGDFHFKEDTALRPEDQKVSCVPDITVYRRNNDRDEFVILGCDGIWDVQSNDECIDMIRDIWKEGETDVGTVCEEVLDLTLKKGSTDNMTALIVQLPAVCIGEGGGVKTRREKRKEERKLKWGERCPDV